MVLFAELPISENKKRRTDVFQNKKNFVEKQILQMLKLKFASEMKKGHNLK